MGSGGQQQGGEQIKIKSKAVMWQVDLDAGSEIRIVSIIQTGTLVSLIAKLSCYKNQLFCHKTSTGILIA